MKRLYLILLMVFAMMVPAMAQSKGKSHKEMRKELKEYHLKFLAQEMELKDDQQKEFFEIYGEMLKEKHEVLKAKRSAEKKIKESKKPADADYEAVNSANDKLSQIDKKYDEKFSKVLTPKQIFKMKEAEEKFRAKAHEMRHSRKNKK